MQIVGTYLHEGKPLIVGQVERRSHCKSTVSGHTTASRLTSARFPRSTDEQLRSSPLTRAVVLLQPAHAAALLRVQPQRTKKSIVFVYIYSDLGPDYTRRHGTKKERVGILLELHLRRILNILYFSILLHSFYT
jgi:hypothetical protein